MAIIKANELIETSYKLSAREQFFVLHLISEISQNERDLKEHKMHFSEIEKIMNFDGKRRIANKKEVFSLMDKLNSEPIIYEKGSVVGKSVWLQHLEHDTDSDIFTFSLSDKLKEHLLQLKEHFTKYNLSNIVYLNANAVRLYEVLKRHQFKGECDLSVEKVKFYLGIEKSYPKFYEFKRWVLIPSQKEIEKYTDIRFEFMPAKKHGKRIMSLRFFIYENEPNYSTDTIEVLSKVDRSIKPKKKLEERKSINNDLIKKVSKSKYLAFELLADKGVNKAFISNQILTHQKLNYEPLLGYEDIYVKALWKYLSDKTNVDKPAGAFVSWWKSGKLTEDNLHARMMEYVIKQKKGMKDEEISKREASKRVTMYEFSQTNSSLNSTMNMQYEFFQKSTSNFDIDKFKNEHPNIYKSIMAEVKQKYVESFEGIGESFDPAKHRNAIENQVIHKCKEKYNQLQKVA